jgi:hypothetical protein
VSCAAFRERLDRGGAADAHGHICSSCSAWLGRQRRAQAALARLAGTLDGAGAPPRVEAALRRAFRERFEPAPADEVAVFATAPRPFPWAVAAVAACLVVAIALVLVRKGPAGATRAVADARPALATRAVAPKDAAGAPATLGAKPASRAEAAAAPRVPPLRPKPPSAPPAPLAATFPPADEPRAATSPIADSAGPAREADASASATPAAAAPDTRAFYPLRPEPDASLVDSGQVIRVQLRGDVLRAAGLSPAPGSGERIEAEVLVGPDGIARGIRLARPRR